MGRIVHDFHNQRICNLLKDHQGTVVIGNGNAGDDGNVTPTVILNPSKESAVMKDEIFGPILPVLSFQKIDDAIQIIKDNGGILIYVHRPSQDLDAIDKDHITETSFTKDDADIVITNDGTIDQLKKTVEILL